MAKSRWELEAERKKKAQQQALAAAQQAIKRGAAYKGNAVTDTVKKAAAASTAKKTSTTPKASTVTVSKPQGANIPAFLQGSGRTTAEKVSTPKQQNGFSSLQTMAEMPTTVQSIGNSVLQTSNDMRNLQRNSLLWHGTTDANERARLKSENDAIRKRLGLSYDPSGVTYDAKTGKNYSLMTDILYGASDGKRARATADYAKSREMIGKSENDIVVQPTYEQVLTYGADTARGINAHQVMADLFNRAAETWSEADTAQRDAAKNELANEMTRILEKYGLTYSESGLGTSASWGRPNIVSDRTAIEKLRAAGADETTLAYVQENIQMREAADRLGQGIEAASKRFIASIPALFETSRQQSENTEESRENPEYVQLEERAQQLELQLQSMNSQDADGKVPADYMAVYNEWQDVRKRLDELAVKTPVDQSLWGQTMLREASEAQANATAGLSAVPRFLADTGISIAGNAPTMALSAVPVAGPAIGATLMGASAAGQRAAELNAQGISPGEALGRGITSGVIEAVTEKLPLDTMAELLQRGGTTAVKNILRQMGVEAGEESASYLMNYVADLAANDPNAKFSFAELAQSALGGAVSGGFFGAAGSAIGGTRQGQVNNAEMQKTGQADGTATVSSSGFFLPEAKRQRMAAQDAAYAAQIDDVFRGNMPTDRAVSIGDTPDILLSIGATDLPMTMKQSTARKIAFPAGYMGGAHNLGVPALKRLPEQLRDPAAVLRSKTQPDSFVVLTEWNDTNGNPVIIALHLDKQGVVDVINEVASAYGKNNFAALTGENGENVLYTKNNKSIDQILDDRLQLPALLSDDTLVAYSIAQQAEKSNAERETQALGARMAELDAQKRQAEGLLPGPARDRAIAQAEQAMREEQQQAAQTGTQQTISAPGAQVPASEAMQYGKPPELAMMEARERARNVAAQEARQSERKEIVSALSQAWNEKRAAELQAEQTLNGLTLTQYDIEMAQNAARTGMDSQNWEQADNPEKAYIYGKALRDVREADQPIRQFFAQRAAALESEAQKAADAIATHAKDKRWGAAYQRETMERNIRDIFGKSHQQEAEAIIREYITPVHQAVAEGNRLKNNLRDRVKELKLNKHESALTQMRLEGEDGAAAEYIKNNNITVTPAMDAKISRAVQEFRNIYNELYNQINETLLLNGQEPAPFRKNYAPHFTKDKPDTLLDRVRFALGLGKDSSLNVPTDIAGITDTFRPGKKWFGNLLQREGEITDYDAVAGFDQYIETAADVITLTESIQKLRALEDQVRYTLSDEGVKAQIDKIKADANLDALQQREQIEKVYDDNRTTVQKLIADIQNQKRMGMGRFVTELRRYTDNLAGKKSREDRGWEDMANRQVYQLAKSLEGRVAANMISLNPGSWLTNVIPITQATGEVSVLNLLRGMYQTVKASVKDDGYVDASTFLTNRYGSQQLDRTLTRKVSDISGAPMEVIDHFTANTIHRARYNQNIEKGMSVSDAIDDADAFTASLMADRSKGAVPTVFNATNPVRKVFTMFQTEVNNQLSYLFKDMPKAQRQKGVAAVAWAYTKVFAGAYFYNLLYSQIVGRDAALDPIGMIADALGVGDDEDEEKTAAERVTGLVEDIGGQIPFVGGVLFDGGRVPISSAIPNFANLGKAAMPGLFGVEWSGEKRLQTAAKELAKPATYLLPPFGGGAAKKAIEGFATVKAGGSYTYDNQGNLQLQFPAYGQSPIDYAKAMLFGKWSSEEAQKYIDSGFKGLSADETSAYNKLRDNMGVNPRDAMEAILSIRGFESVKDADGNTLQTVKEQQRMALFDNEILTPEQKAAIDSALIVSGEDEMPADYTDRNSFILGQYINENRQDAARAALESGLTVDQFVKWDDRLHNIKSQKDRFDKKQYTDAQANAMVLDEIIQDSTLSDSEKEAIADYVIISSIGEEDEKTRQNWENIAKGKVNASDFVRFQADASIYDDWAEGTGTDNAANVAKILRGYEGLTDEQRDVLFQTYRDNMSVNPFHVSVYEKAIDANGSFFSALTDDGKARLRSLLNEYEQDINEGAELDEWRAKAYMAEKEAGIAPGIYAMYRVALETANTDGKGNPRQSEAEACVNAMDGLTQYQKAYLYASTNSSWKNNPFGNATVGEYSSGLEIGINPIEGGTVTSGFGPRDSFQTDNGAMSSSNHPSIDIGAPEGTPIGAYKSGKVTKNGWVDGYGWTIEVTHSDGIVSAYHHMMEQSPVSVGTEVTQGDQIGKVGQTGNSKGAHLDLTITRDGKPIDPASLIPELKDSATGYVWTGSNVYTNVTSGSGESSGGSSSKSTSNSLKKLKTPKQGLGGLDSLF